MKVKILIVNLLTLIRVIGTIILVPIYNIYGGFYVGIVAIICYLTDSIDGILARLWNVSTFFGALFDGVADKLFTIMCFIVLYLITPYSIIPIIFELLIVLVQFCKFKNNLNIQSNIIGKFKVWVLALSVVLIFFVSDINSISFLSLEFKEFVLTKLASNTFLILLIPVIVIESLTLLSYILEIFTIEKIPMLNHESKELEVPKLKKNKWENFKMVWLNPEYYEKHKNDSYLRKLIKLKDNNKC